LNREGEEKLQSRRGMITHREIVGEDAEPEKCLKRAREPN